MEKIKIDERKDKIVLGKKETMYIYWNKLAPEKADVIAFGHPGDEIIVEYFLPKRVEPVSISLRGVMLFDVNFYTKREKEVNQNV